MPINGQGVCIITGCTRGIGYELVKGILSTTQLVSANDNSSLGGPRWAFSKVVLSCRSLSSFNDLVAKLQKDFEQFSLLQVASSVIDRSIFIPFDLEKPAVVEEFNHNFKKALGDLATCDVLLSNAGFLAKDALEKPEHAFDEYDKTILINYNASKRFVIKAINLMERGTGRIVITGSEKGFLYRMADKQLAEKIFIDKQMTVDQVDELMIQFNKDYHNGLRPPWVTTATGHPDNKSVEKTVWRWHPDAYSTIKSMYNLFARALSAKLEKEGLGVTVNMFHPGHCQTELSGWTGKKTAAEGAETGMWLATEPNLLKVTGKIYIDKKEADIFGKEEAELNI